jgi:MFS family permease
MKEWFKFILGHKRLVNFGFLYTFFSSYGQTFFISLYVPFWSNDFNISNTLFGSIYSGATIGSALLMPVSGKYIDTMPVKKYSFIVFLGFIFSVLLLSRANNVILLSVGLLFIRLFAQGLLTHTSATVMAKYFDVERGKALGITGLGLPAGQFILPLLVLPLIYAIGWKNSLLLLAAVASLLLLPSLWAVSPHGHPLPHSDNKIKSNLGFLRELKFWIIAANIFIVPFIFTAIFLFQYKIGHSQGYDDKWIAFSFAVYAVFNALSLLFSGTMIDRFSGIFLFPLYLVPTLIGLSLFSFVDNRLIFPVFYALLGISSGMGTTIRTAVQAEIYGTARLGKIRSYFTTILVTSAALGTPLFGYLIDKEISLKLVMLTLTAVVFLILLLSFRIMRYR